MEHAGDPPPGGANAGRARPGLTAAGARALAGALLLLPAAFGTGCGSAPEMTTGATAATASCGVATENAQILATMRDWYYWYQSLPAGVDAAAYPTPSALLDALRHRPLDRFSYLTTQAADRAFYGAGQYVGYGITFTLTPQNELQLRRVLAGSPAGRNGLARGDTVTALDGVPVPALVADDQLDSTLSAADPGKTLTVTFRDLQARSRSVTLTSAVVTLPSVERVATFSAGGRPVGYLLFNSFVEASSGQLDQAFAQLAGEGVGDLVIDERYNGGGLLSVAQHLASLIAGNGVSGRLLGRLTYNDRHADRNQSLSFQSAGGALGLRRVYVITTDATASASEFLINALAPYVEVITVGSATLGKPVGENGFAICGDVLYPMTFRTVNARGDGDYFDGIPPTCDAADDLTLPLGDPNEASLATALGHVATGTCGARGPAAARENADRAALRPPQARRYGFRQLVGGY